MGAQFDGNLRRDDLLTDTPYNTYTRAGLPPTPISLPGLAALQATLHPHRPMPCISWRAGWQFGVSATLERHNRAVNKYQK